MSVHNGSIWIDNNWALLPLGMWVAASANRIEAESPDYNGLIALLIGRGVGFSDVTVVFVPQFEILQ